MKSKILLCLALVLDGGLTAWTSPAAESATNAEPRYLDKPLSEWIPLARFTGGDVLRLGDERAPAAIQEIGTNALPWLLRWIRSDQPETVQIGVEGFNRLGPVAKPAVPELIRLAGDWQSSSLWSNAFPALAAVRDPDSIPFLQSAAANAGAPEKYRLRVVQALAEARWMTNTVVAIFVRCLQDPDWRLVAKGADGLRAYATEPATAIPALATCWSSRTNPPAGSITKNVADLAGDAAVRLCVMGALDNYSSIYYYRSRNSPVVDPAYIAQIRESIRPVMPMFVQALGDEDGRVVWSAVHVLGNMALEPDLTVPALVKAMDYPQRNVQQEAIIALGNFGAAAQSAVPALAHRAQTDPQGYAGGPSAAEALTKIVPQAK